MAKKKSLLWHLFFSYMLITLLSLVAVTWYSTASLKNFLLRQAEADLEERALLFSPMLLEHLSPYDEKAIDDLCKTVGRTASTRITVILPWGKVVGDSDHDPARMDNHFDRPEVAAALEGSMGVATRYSPTLGKEMMYAAIALKKDSRNLGVLRSAIPVDNIGKTQKAMEMRIVYAGLVIAVVAAFLSLLLSQRIRRPIDDIEKGAEAFSRGEFDVHLPSSGLAEIAGLSETMKRMAGELREQIRTITAQRNELEAVLSSMVEGVFGVDQEERLLGMNPSAARILGCNPAKGQGRTIQEVIRLSELQHFVVGALSSEKPVEKDLILYGEAEKIVRAHGTPLRDAEGKRVGVLIVLNDVTRLAKLENIRKDFVANVSHEIKTPITAIKGFVETLQEGQSQDPADVRRFLEIIHRHVDRLEAIVEDLLSLSRIEKEAEAEEIVLEEHPVRLSLAKAVQSCEDKAQSKKIHLELECSEDLKGRINPLLLEQAVVNLIDNAINSSEEGKSVTIKAREREQEILIQVEDHGSGIERKHLDRIFERFYRVDKSRSRKLGGTGLGLSIVKHIVEAHGGRVSVESQPGLGSTFTLHLPGLAGTRS
jgi:two-component system, OmpR family, phosphate regulon sensor histidine kinase PhoR